MMTTRRPDWQMPGREDLHHHYEGVILICDMNTDNHDQIAMVILIGNEEYDRANAPPIIALITAAPDMLEALRMLMDEYETPGPVRENRREIIAARAAIAKATTITPELLAACDADVEHDPDAVDSDFFEDSP